MELALSTWPSITAEVRHPETLFIIRQLTVLADVAYSPEDDTHFPSLSVKNTLAVAAKMRTPQHRVSNVSRPEFVQSKFFTYSHGLC
jgi:ABC-type multidrug transport system ATPase subunit